MGNLLEASPFWCCVLIRYFYCFKLDGVIWQVSARAGNEGTVCWRRPDNEGKDQERKSENLAN
jgi:hypothetical protein